MMVKEKDTNNYKNPFNFQHFNFARMQLSSDIHTNIPAIEADFDKNEYLDAYSSLFNASNIFFADKGNGISRSSYKEGQTIVGWDLTSDLSASQSHVSLSRSGSMRLEVQFRKDLTEPIVFIIYGEFDNHITISKDRFVLIG